MLIRAWIQIGSFFLILAITLSTIQNPITGGYVDEMRGHAEQVMKEEDPLYMEILRQKRSLDEEPIDAHIDRVWKAVPGLNGRTVSVQASYEKMKSNGSFMENQLIFNETSPSVTLSDLPAEPIYRGNPKKPMTALMINVAWGNEYLPKMLTILKENNIHGTFFLDGSWVKNNANLARMIQQEGHEIGNHAYSHPNMQQLSNDRIREEISRTNDVIQATLNVSPKWFAPPSGSYREDVVKLAREYDMYTVLWTVDTVDWKNPNPSTMVNNVVSKTESGSLILMHPTASSVEGLNQMINEIEQKGLKLGTLSKVLSEKRISQ